MTTDTAAVDEAAAQEQRLHEAGARMLAMGEALEAAGLTLTDLFLSLDTAGFERLGPSFGDHLDMHPPERVATVRRSRLFWQREPIIMHAERMWTGFTFGRPWQVQAQEDGFQAVIDEVFDATTNRRSLGRRAMKMNSRRLLVDGERWFAFFVGRGAGAPIRVRTFDALEIAEVLSNPEDKDEPWYYRRTWTDVQGKVHTRFYRDWDFVDESGNPRNDEHPRMKRDIADAGTLGDVRFVPEPDVWLTSLAINTLGERGYPLFTAGLDWVRAFREFMRDRSSLTAARAQFAYSATVKGGQKAADAVRSAFEQIDVLDPTASGLRRPRAGVWTQNEGIDLQQMNMQTDGASALNDMRALRLMAILCGGLAEHLYGDVSTGNLATAQALEEPLAVILGDYQELWVEWREDVHQHLAQWRGFNGETAVDIDPPPITKRDIAKFSSAFGIIAQHVPAVTESPEVVSMMLTDLGLNNVDEVMEVLEDKLERPDPAEFGLPGQGTPFGQRQRPPRDEGDAEQEAARLLAEAVRRKRAERDGRE